MASQTIVLGSRGYGEETSEILGEPHTSYYYGWATFPGFSFINNPVNQDVDGSLITGSDSAQLVNFVAFSGLVSAIQITLSGTGSEFIDRVENNETAFTLQRINNDGDVLASIVIPGPANWSPSDTSEPYQGSPSNFNAVYNFMSVAGRYQLVIFDGISFSVRKGGNSYTRMFKGGSEYTQVFKGGQEYSD